MPTGHLKDPRMRSGQKGFGILSYTDNGRTRDILYLKDDISRDYDEGTEVTFELQTRKVTYDKPTVITSNKEQNYKAIDDLLKKDLRLVEIEVATKVRAVEEQHDDELLVIDNVNWCLLMINGY